jgi:hypothetical protein
VELAAIAGIALGAGACLSGVEESNTLSADGGESSSTAAETTSIASTSEGDTSASAATDESGSSPSTTSGDPTGEETSGTEGADDSEASDGPAETTSEPSECDGLDAEECEAAEGVCMSVVASPFVPTSGSNYCIGDPEFVGCLDVVECKAGEFVRCDFGDDAWLLKSSCAPAGWMACEEPGNGHAGDCR